LLLSVTTLTVQAKNTILILGDSISAAHGISVDSSWPKLLELRLLTKKYPYLVVNASQSGDTTSNGLSRLPVLLKQYHPVIVLLALGGNDGLQGKQPSLIKMNLQKMINLVLATNAIPLLIGIRLPPNFGEEYNSQFVAVYRDLAKENKIALVPSLMNGFDENEKNFQADRVHPISEVQPVMMDNVWVVLKPLI